MKIIRICNWLLGAAIIVLFFAGCPEPERQVLTTGEVASGERFDITIYRTFGIPEHYVFRDKKTGAEYLVIQNRFASSIGVVRIYR